MRRVLSIFFKSALSLIIAVVFFIVLIFLPPVQSFVVSRISKALDQHIPQNVEIESVSITPFGKITLDNISVTDTENQRLLYIPKIKGQVNFLYILTSEFRLSSVEIDSLNLKITHYEQEEKNNLAKFLDNFKLQVGSAIKFLASSVLIRGAFVSYINLNETFPQEYYADDINVYIGELKLFEDDFRFRLNKLNFDSNYFPHLKNMSFLASYNAKELILKDFLFTTSQSDLEIDCHYKNFDSTITNLWDRIAASDAQLELKSNRLDLSEFSMFSSYFSKIPNLKLKISSYTEKGDIFISGLEVFSEDCIYFYSDGQFTPQDGLKNGKGQLNIKSVVFPFKEDIMKLLHIPMRLDKDVIVGGKFEYEKQELYTDINLKSDSTSVVIEGATSNFYKPKEADFQANITIKKLDLDYFMPNLDLGKTDAFISVIGRELGSEKTRVLNVYGNIPELEYKKFNHKDIFLEASLSGDKLVMNSSMSNKNLDYQLNLESEKEALTKDYILKLKLNVEKINFNELNLSLSEKQTSLKTNLSMYLKGKSIDDVLGNIYFTDTKILRDDEDFQIDTIRIESLSLPNNKEKIKFSADKWLEGSISGSFVLSQMGDVFKNAINSHIHSYDFHKVDREQNFDIKLTFNTKNSKFIYDIFGVSGALDVKAKLSSYPAYINFDLSSSSFVYKDKLIDNFKLNVNNLDNFNLLSASLKNLITPSMSFSGFGLKVEQREDSLIFKSDFYSLKGKDTLRYSINPYIIEDKDGDFIKFGFLNSYFKQKKAVWSINTSMDKGELVYFTKAKKFVLDSLEIKSKNSTLDLSGYYYSNENFNIKFDASKIEIEELFPDYADIKMSGELNASLSFYKNAKENKIEPKVNLSIKKLSVQKALIGDAELKIDTDQEDNIRTDFFVLKDNNKSIRLYGDAKNEKNKLNLDMMLELNNLDISPTEKVIPLVFSKMGGSANGKVSVTGSLLNPQLNGEVIFDDLLLKVDYTNVAYKSRIAKARIKDSQFLFEDFQFKDVEYGTPVIVNGTIYHKDYFKWALKYKIDADQTFVFNTNRKMNPIFWGRLWGTGTVDIYGAFEDVRIDVKARPNRRSVFEVFIDQTDNITATNSNLVQFAPSNKIKQDDILKKITERKSNKNQPDLTVNLNLSLNPEALVKVLLDDNGHEIFGRAEGNLILNVSPTQDIKMNGVATINGGQYVFVYREIIKRQFNLVSGSTIAWDGNMENPLLNINANYKTYVNPSSFLQGVGTSTREETVLGIHLTGTLNNPLYTFGISMPKASESIKEELAYKTADQEQLNQQFISLMAFNMFTNTSGETQNQNMVQTGVAGLTTEMLFTQFSSIINRFITGVDINVNLSQGTNIFQTAQQERTDIEVGISKKLFNDRVTVNGVVGVPTSSVQSNLVGDVEIEYNISSDGRLRGVFSNRREEDYMNNQQGYAQSLGVSYRQEFNNFKELGKLIKGNFKTKKEKEREKQIKDSLSAQTQKNEASIEFK